MLAALRIFPSEKERDEKIYCRHSFGRLYAIPSLAAGDGKTLAHPYNSSFQSPRVGESAALGMVLTIMNWKR